MQNITSRRILRSAWMLCSLKRCPLQISVPVHLKAKLAGHACTSSAIMAADTAPAAEMQLMPPPKPRVAPRKLPAKPQQLVLEEDEWAEQLEAIIERDFFPDVPKLQSKLEWLQVCHQSMDSVPVQKSGSCCHARRIVSCADAMTPISKSS